MEDKDIFRLVSVDFSYKRGDKKAIDSISLNIANGHFWGIIGPNGSGKTTLLDLLSGFKKISSGKLIFNGKPIQTYKKKELATMISYAPQQFYINMPFKVEEIILMGRHPFISRFSMASTNDLKIVEYVIQMLDLDYLRHRYITELSGGEQQRVMFARALAQDTSVMLLDEPTSNMDINYTLRIMDILEHQVKKEKTAIMAIHDINIAALYCDRLIVLKDGRLVCYGDACQILDKNILKDVFGVDCEVYKEHIYGKKQIIFKKDFYCISSGMCM